MVAATTGARVTPIELFFDLVFVFGLTQITTLMAHDVSVHGIVRGLLVLGLWIFCFIDVLMTPETACRNLPKLAWVFIVLLVPFLGSIGWLVAGRPWNRSAQTYVSSRSSSRVAASRPAATRR